MVDADKLAALVAQQNMNPYEDMPGNDDDDEHEMMEDEGEDKMSPEDHGAELLANMGDFGEDLRENVDILDGIAEGIGKGLKDKDPSEEVVEAVEDKIADMPEEMVSGMADNFSDLSEEDLYDVAAALETEEAASGDVEMLAGLLQNCAECVGNPSSDEDEEDDDEDDDEDMGNNNDTDEEYDEYQEEM